jgi:hypothetical protein
MDTCFILVRAKSSLRPVASSLPDLHPKLAVGVTRDREREGFPSLCIRVIVALCVVFSWLCESNEPCEPLFLCLPPFRGAVPYLPFYSPRGGQVTIREKEWKKRDVSERYNRRKKRREVG